VTIFGLDIKWGASTPEVEATKASGEELITRIPRALNAPSGGSSGGWFGWMSTVSESFAGAWQRNITLRVDTAMSHCTAWACITLIASDIAKMRLKLVALDDADGIWTETSNPAYSPVLRKPNHYQNRIQFVTSWIISKLTRGNTYVLKERDARGVVKALYILDPDRVQVLVAPNGDVFYALSADPLSGLYEGSVTVPADEIIHDILVPLFHPLCGVSPFYALGSVVSQGLKIIANSGRFFENGSRPSGILTAPSQISDVVATRIREHWEKNYAGQDNFGRVAVLGDGLKYEPMSMTAVDSQLIDQLKWGDEKVCSVLHMPPYMVGVGPMPSYNNIGALNQQYYAQCLQNLIESLELCLDEGLGLSEQLGVECDLEGLLRMDAATQVDIAVKGVRGGLDTPNEGRKKFGKPPIAGGDTVYLQEQDHSLEWLSRRDQMPITSPVPAPPALPTPLDSNTADENLKAFDYAAFRSAVMERVKDLHAAA
jgi:HK97 family phage portal protein